jgi:hypothetical protein
MNGLRKSKQTKKSHNLLDATSRNLGLHRALGRMGLFGRNQIHAALGALTRLLHLNFGMHRARPDLRLSTAMGCGVIGVSAMTAMRLQG